MGLRKLWFPIALAILWVAVAALAMVDFANFAATTQPRRPVAKQERPLHSTRTAGRPTPRLAPPRS
ncbi:MAG TPA: hypothetical protein VMK66_19865 [Myxococcales bacterium]|nr:hypothetical protein [Myxococcales bacterium]